jgi:hypothetical protein
MLILYKMEQVWFEAESFFISLLLNPNDKHIEILLKYGMSNLWSWDNHFLLITQTLILVDKPT